MREIFLFQQDDNNVVGLSSFKRRAKPVMEPVKKNTNKELKLSDLMRRV
jgi:hypothetical protein